MVERYNAEVYVFVPILKSINWVKSNVHNNKFHFYPYGSSVRNQKEKFYLPQNENYVSGSMCRHKGLKQNFIEVEMFCLKTVLN